MTAAVVAFVGPSLPLSEARALLPNGILQGPAQRGDVLRALEHQPRVIALIDGLFETAPSVWHQELRAALDAGVTVLGASSMGALRAVELAPYGMQGVGNIYQAYVDGRLWDDADVALLHASLEFDYRPLTVPFVAVVAAAEKAVESRILSVSTARALVDAARSVHYKERRWPALLDAVAWKKGERLRWDRWRSANPCDPKADDARACLQRAVALASQPPAPPRSSQLSVWTRQLWLDQLQTPEWSPGDLAEYRETYAANDRATDTSEGRGGLRTLMLAEWARQSGLVPDPARVRALCEQPVPAPLALRQRWAEAIALEEEILAHPEKLLPQAPLKAEGVWVEGMRTGRWRSRGRI